VAVPYTNAVSVVANYGESLAGKILVDISNPFNADASGLVTTTGNSAAQELTAATPEGTQVVKALNSIFGRSSCSPGGRTSTRRKRPRRH
jgi:predicted dinucleotide-binding enzyme